MAAAALLLVLSAATAGAASLITGIVTHPLTGVAIDGYDPVTYFTEPEPQPGSPDYEYYWNGVPWYFVSAANRDVFKRAPDVYAPLYGGHCSMSLARGYLSDGKPRIYVVEKLKVYLFYSAANREAFLLSPEAAIAEAGANWSRLAPTLSWPEGAEAIPEAAPPEGAAVAPETAPPASAEPASP